MENIAEAVFEPEELHYLEHLRAFALAEYRNATRGLVWDSDVGGAFCGKDQGASMFIAAVAQSELCRSEILFGDWELGYGAGEHRGVFNPELGEYVPHVWLKNKNYGLYLDLACEYLTGDTVVVVRTDDSRHIEGGDMRELTKRLLDIDYHISSVCHQWFEGGERVLPERQGKTVSIS